MGRAASEGVGSNWGPSGIAQTRGGFDDHDLVAGPVDVESKLIRPHAETAIAGFHLRFPEHRQTTAKPRTPSQHDGLGVVGSGERQDVTSRTGLRILPP
jgi:hypothetical protein